MLPLTLIPVAPADASLDVALYGGTYRLTGTLAGKSAFWFDLYPTYGPRFQALVDAALTGQDQCMAVPAFRAELTAADGTLRVTGVSSGEGELVHDWTLGAEAVRQLGAWLAG